MAEQGKILFEKMFIGDPVEIGTSKERYQDFLMEGEEVRMEFKGFRDALIFTDLRMAVIDPQGLRGKKGCDRFYSVEIHIGILGGELRHI